MSIADLKLPALQKVLVEVTANGIATVTLHNPDKLNAFNDEMIAELHQVFTAIGQSVAVRIMLLAASGKHFSAGGDLAWMQSMAEFDYAENKRDAGKLAAMLQALNELDKPTIARVQGAAYGGAVGLVSCCDMAVTTPAAAFSLSEVKVGLLPATISPYVIAAIGARAARRYFLTAERFTAERALELGLVSDVVAADQLDQRIDELCVSLLENSPAAMAAAKVLISRVCQRPVDDVLIDYTCDEIARIRVSPEGQEGLQAFLQKRAPAWRTGESR